MIQMKQSVKLIFNITVKIMKNKIMMVLKHKEILKFKEFVKMKNQLICQV
jgi:hypothetical protein